MTVSLIESFVFARDNFLSIADTFNLRENRTLIVVDRANNTRLQITPNPSIRFISSRMDAAFLRSYNLQVELDTLQVSGISKAYTEGQLTGTGFHYVVDGAIDDVNSGKIYDRVPGVSLMSTPLGWNLYLKERR